MVQSRARVQRVGWCAVVGGIAVMLAAAVGVPRAIADDLPAPTDAPLAPTTTLTMAEPEVVETASNTPILLDSSLVTSIATPEDLLKFAQSVNAGDNYTGVTVTLANNIDMTGKAWKPIGSLAADPVSGFEITPASGEEGDLPSYDSGRFGGSFFQGTFEGGGFTISGLSSDTVDGSASAHENALALLSVVGKQGTVKNLAVEASFTGTNNVAGIAAVNLGTVSSCTFSGSLHADEKDTILLSSPGMSGVGGIVGTSFGTVNYCKTENGSTVYRGGGLGGGIVGLNCGSIDSCENHASLTCGTTRYPGPFTTSGGYGGIAGDSNIPADNKGALLWPSSGITNCVNYGSIEGTSQTGGIVGTTANASCDNCVNVGEVKGTGGSLGGIVGLILQKGVQNITITKCTNTGDVTGSNQVGGIAGNSRFITMGFAGGSVAINDCLNQGAITAQTLGAGIVGTNLGEVNRSFNTGAVTVLGTDDEEDTAGGIVALNPGLINDCGNTGDVRYAGHEVLRMTRVGGIAGSCDSSGGIKRSYNMARVLIDADVDYVENYIYPGGVVGFGDYIAAIDCYYCAELAGDATALNPSLRRTHEGIPALDMLGERALTGMPKLFEGDSPWSTAAPLSRVESIVVTPPFLAGAGASASGSVPESRMTAQTAALFSQNYYTVALPTGEGYTAAAAEDQRGLKVLEGGDFHFTVTIAEGYTGANMVVRANGVALGHDADGCYVVKDILADQTITVEGIAKAAAGGAGNDGSSKDQGKGSAAQPLAKTGDATLPVTVLVTFASIAGLVAAGAWRRARDQK